MKLIHNSAFLNLRDRPIEVSSPPMKRSDLMNNLRKVLFATGIIVAAAVPRHASAQEARSLEQLEVLVKPGDTVWVTDTAGKELKGRIDQLTSATLRVKSNGVTHDFLEKDVLKVRHSDSLKNGTLIGAGVGAGFGTLGLIAACFSDDCSWGAAFLGSWTGIGALTGMGIDAIHGHRKTIYRSSPSSALTRIRIAPLVRSTTKGVLVSMSF